MLPRLLAALALATAACVPDAGRPGSNYDAGPLVPFDAGAEDVAAVDRPVVDRPVFVDRGVDAGASDVPAATGDGPDPARMYPLGPYGALIGNPFPPFQIASCAGGTYMFAGSDWVAARATVVEITTGYCAGCQELSAALQTRVAGPYTAQRVRVVGVLTGGSSPDTPASQAFCEQWIAAAHIAHPMTLDLGDMLSSQTVGMPAPQWVLVDSDGRIRWRAMGSTAQLDVLVAQINGIVGGP